MVIISLVTAGVGLAIDAYSERKARRGERRRSSDGQIDGEINTASEDTKQQQEQDAFNELQNYADFQSDLSTKVLNDLSRGEISAYNRPPWPSTRPMYHEPRYLAYPNGVQQGRLEWPIIIPRGDSQDGSSCWVRAYPRPLLEFGIDQDTFLNILDSFDVHISLSARLEAVNIASITSGVGWRDSPENFSRSIPAAVQVMKAYQKDRKSNSFLNHVNALTFRPHGLFAMVITFRQESPLQVIHVEASASVPHPEDSMQMSTAAELTMPFKAVPMTDTFEAGSSRQSYYQTDESKDNDFLQRKRYFEKISKMHAPRTKLFQLPVEPGSPSTAPPNRSPLSNILSSVAKHREKRNEALNKRLRRDKRLPSRSGTPLGTGMMSTTSKSSKGKTQAGQSDEKMGIENGALYFVIVNDPDDATSNHDMGFDDFPQNRPYTFGTETHTTEPPAYSEKHF